MKFDELCNKIETFLSDKQANTIEEVNQNIQQSQLFLLDNLKKIKMDSTKKSIQLEQIAKLINFINDITDFYLTRNIKISECEDILNKKIIDKNFSSPLEKIKKIKNVEGKFLVDSENVILDLNMKNTFKQYVHATSRVDTDEGQGKLLFDNNMFGKSKNLYIISCIINKNHNGKLFHQDKDLSLLNLLPFLTMVNKITTQKTTKTLNENLYYFFKTSLIVIGNDIWNDYCNNIMKFYTNKNISVRDWIYSSCDFNDHLEKDVINNILIYLKLYTVKIISFINLSNIKIGLQDNELLVLKQLHRLIKTIIFFMEKEGIRDEDYIQKTKIILELIEERDCDFNSLNLKNIKYNKQYRLTSEVMQKENSFHDLFIIKRRLDLIKNYDDNISTFDFIISLLNIYNFSKKSKEIFIESKNKSLYQILEDESDYFKKNFNNMFFENIPKGLLIFETIAFWDFPSFDEKKFFIKDKKNKEIMFLFFFLYVYKNNNSMLIRIQKYAKRDYFYGYKSIIDNKFWKILLISKMLLNSKGFNFSHRETLELRKIHSLYIDNITIYNNNYFKQINAELINLAQEIEGNNKNMNVFFQESISNSIKNKSLIYQNLQNEKIPLEFSNFDMLKKSKQINFDASFLFNYLSDDKSMCKVIELFFDLNKILPIDYAKYLYETLSSTFLIYFTIQLDNYKYKYLKDSLLWFISHDYEGFKLL